MGTVKQDANGVPEEWTLLRAGVNRLVKNGKDYELRLSVEDMDAIAAYQAKKGEAVPIDSNHYLHILAEKHGVEESEALRLIPSGVAAMGFGTLFREGDELRIRAEWTPGAYELLKEKIFRYCSPVIRGLKEGPIRITSVAMENEPALNCEDVLAAGGEGEDADPEDIGRNTVELKRLQDPIERALGRLLGKTAWNEIVLSGEDDEESAFKRTAAAIEAKADTLAAMREGLGVKDGEPDEVMSTALAAVKMRADQADALQKELDTMVCTAEEKRKAELIEQGLQEGKLTHALEDWAKTQDCAVLASYLEHAPTVVPGRMGFAPDKHHAPKRSLSAADEEMIRKFGFDKDVASGCQYRTRGAVRLPSECNPGRCAGGAPLPDLRLARLQSWEAAHMTDQDKNEIAAIFTDILASYDHGCPNGIDAKTANTLRSLAEAFQTGRKTTLKALVTIVIGAVCAALLAGMKELFNK